MKKITILCAVLLALAAATGAFAQSITIPPASLPAAGVDSGVEFQAAPESVISTMSAGRFGSDADDFIDVIYWSGVELENFFAFAGGTGAPTGAQVNLGFAKKLGGSLLSVYYSGDIFAGSGTHNENPASSTTTVSATENLTPTNNLALLFGLPGIGGFRLDLLFADQFSSTGNGGDGTSTSAPFITTIQWGTSLPLGGITLRPQVTFGVRWWETTNSKDKTYQAASQYLDEEVTTTGTGGADNPVRTAGGTVLAAMPDGDGAIFARVAATLGFDSGWAFDLAYGITVDLGQQEETVTKSYTTGVLTSTQTVNSERSGAFWHGINLAARRSISLAENVQFGFKPALAVSLFHWDGAIKTTSKTDAVGGGSTSMDVPVNYGAYFGLEIKPTIALGLSWKATGKFTFYTGTTITVLDYTYAERAAGADRISAESAWGISGLAAPQLGIGLLFEPVSGLGIEFGISRTVLGFGLDGTSAVNPLAGGNLAGTFLISFKK